MLITDLNKLPAGQAFACSICIVGAGPAGLTLATELAGTHHQVLVIESGGTSTEEEFSTALNEVENLGVPRTIDQRMVRNRVLGGSSYTWSGRCIPLDTLDYEARPWVPFSGWPLTAADLSPFLDRASAYLGLRRGCYKSAPEELENSVQKFGLTKCSDLRSVLWHFSADNGMSRDFVRFGARFAALKASNVRVLTHATLTHINTDGQGRAVQSLEVANAQGTRFVVTPKHTVLCGGALENARILLASSRILPAGVGNAHGLVGRFLMDHPRATVGTFAPEHAHLVEQILGIHHTASNTRVQCGFALSAEVQSRERLLNAAAWITHHVAKEDVWRAIRTMVHARGGERLSASQAVLQHSGQILPGLWNRFGRRRPLPRVFSGVNLDVMVEQLPDAESRLRLGTRTDALGVPLAVIDWRISDIERRTVLRLTHAVYQQLLRAGYPTPVMADWVRRDRWEEAVFLDAAHPSGTTRMGTNAEAGVVDRNCKVFGVDNLYVSGSSVFPTNGHANPTLMIVSLALRLADSLRVLPATKSAA